jgi:glycolate oxidase FAD binding subunit
MRMEKPETAEQMAALLAGAAADHKTVALAGASTKANMGGPLTEAGIVVSTSALRHVVEYDPRDLTISVEAGLPFAELSQKLAEHRQMLPLDPPFFDGATVGGVVAANCSGPRRRLYGTARDSIIGMQFATLEGKLVQSGGMVVKNVAGLDMAKLLVGSFGTLAAMTRINFKVAPQPPGSRSFLMQFDKADAAIAARDAILRSVLQPAAIDLANPPAAQRLGLEGFVLLVQAGGSSAVLDRYQNELPGATAVEGPAEEALWRAVREFVPEFVAQREQASVVRCSSTLAGLKDVLESSAGPILARAGSGVSYLCFPSADSLADWMTRAAEHPWHCAVEFAPAARRTDLCLWPRTGSDFPMMERVKQMLDPHGLLNKGRLYGRI